MKNKYTIIQMILLIFMVIVVLQIALQLPRREVRVPTKVNTMIKAKTKAINPIDFHTYQAMNPDVYAYIYIKDSVDTPILQHPSDDAHYLHYMLDGIQAYPGAVYSELVNHKDFHDPNTILYGHNDIISHTMFNGIMKFQDATFFDQHRYLYIYTPTSILQYEIFAAYVNDDSHIYYEVENWNDPHQFLAYRDTIIQKDGSIRNECLPTENDRILTLSTCTEDVEDRRFIVQAILKQEIACPKASSLKVDEKLIDSKS